MLLNKLLSGNEIFRMFKDGLSKTFAGILCTVLPLYRKSDLYCTEHTSTERERERKCNVSQIPYPNAWKTITNKASLHLEVFELRSHKLSNSIRVVCAIVSSLKTKHTYFEFNFAIAQHNNDV